MATPEYMIETLKRLKFEESITKTGLWSIDIDGILLYADYRKDYLNLYAFKNREFVDQAVINDLFICKELRMREDANSNKTLLEFGICPKTYKLLENQ